MKKIRKHGFGLALCAILLFCVPGCGNTTEQEDHLIVLEKETDLIPYTFTTVEISDLVRTAKLRCTYKQTHSSEVKIPISQKMIETVYVKEGDTVKKGQLLCELSVQNLEKQVEELEYQIARNELLLSYLEEDLNITISGYWVNFLYYSQMTENDEERLYERVASAQKNSRYKKEDYEDTLEFQRKKLSEMKAELASSRVYAKNSGVVYKLKNNLEGTMSDEDTVIMTIVDTTETLFETKSTEYAPYFKEGDVITMTVKDSSSSVNYEMIPWHMDEWGDTLTFEVVNQGDAGNIAVNAVGNVEMVTGSKAKVLNVPKKTVKNADGKTYVYVLGKDNVREVRWVETGFEGDDRIEIISGLSEGEKVILK